MSTPPAAIRTGQLLPCPRCGKLHVGQASICRHCGAVVPPSELVLADLGPRLGAAIVDALIIAPIVFGIYILYETPTNVLVRGQHSSEDLTAMLNVVFYNQAMRNRVLGAFMILYTLLWPLWESSALQATPGKLLFKLKVTDEQGYPITYGWALVRRIVKNISETLWGVPYVVALATGYRQGIHDFIARTLVVRR